MSGTEDVEITFGEFFCIRLTIALAILYISVFVEVFQ